MKIKLTPAQAKFIEKFDLYTRKGTNPMNYKEACADWKVQFRTANVLARQGILKKLGNNDRYIVEPSLREDLGLKPRIFITKVLRPRRRLVYFG